MLYQLTYAKQKTVSIRIDESGSVHVRAPYGLPRRVCDQLVESKAGWILEKQALVQKRLKESSAFFEGGRKTLPYLGCDYPVKRAEFSPPSFNGTHFTLSSPSNSKQEIKEIAALYQTLLEEKIRPMVENYASLMGVFPQKVGITHARTRWGSCSAQNHLNFSWRLLAAEESVIRYVVIHELAHIREHNHSPRFWRIVAEWCPDCMLSRQKLKTLAVKLNIEHL